MAKLRANMVVIEDSPEAGRIRTILTQLGATVVDPSEAYRLDSYAAIFFTDKPLTRHVRGTKLRSMRFCRIRRTADKLEEAGIDYIPACIKGAEGIVVFSRDRMASGHPMNLMDAVHEIERVCTRFRNCTIDKALKDAAKERKNQLQRRLAVA